ncbi:MAG TPA: hypothetical protein VFJ95_06995, partial [Gammaproteobacteria bacterium]|nr:hypothetical protein [Gammaproteobacteria bacterium]
VLLKYVPDRAMKLTATVNAGWVASAPPPSGTARIGAQVQTSHGDAVAHFARAGDTVLDARLCASVQVAAGDTVFILFEGLAGAGASGAGDGATVTFEDVP